MPQLDFSTFPSQFFWFFVTYVALMLSLSRFIIPKIKTAIDARKSYITQLSKDIADAKHQIMQIEAECHEILLKTWSDLAKETNNQIEQINSDIDERKKEVDLQIKAMQLKSEEKMKSLESNLKLEMQEVIRSSVKIGVNKLISYEIDNQLLDQYIKMDI